MKKVLTITEVYLIYVLLLFIWMSSEIQNGYFATILLIATTIIPISNIIVMAENFLHIAWKEDLLAILGWVAAVYFIPQPKFYPQSIICVLYLLGVFTYFYTHKKKETINYSQVGNVLAISLSVEFILLLFVLLFLGKNWMSMSLLWVGIAFIAGNRFYLMHIYKQMIKKIKMKTVSGVLLEILVGVFITLFFSKQGLSEPFALYIDRLIAMCVGCLLEIPFNPLFAVTREIYKGIWKEN